MKRPTLLTLSACTFSGYQPWLFLRLVEMITVHNHGSHSYILVKNAPFTDKGKINWWLENKDTQKK